jgi:hypothetical protein
VYRKSATTYPCQHDHWCHCSERGSPAKTATTPPLRFRSCFRRSPAVRLGGAPTAGPRVLNADGCLSFLWSRCSRTRLSPSGRPRLPRGWWSVRVANQSVCSQSPRGVQQPAAQNWLCLCT